MRAGRLARAGRLIRAGGFIRAGENVSGSVQSVWVPPPGVSRVPGVGKVSAVPLVPPSVTGVLEHRRSHRQSSAGLQECTRQPLLANNILASPGLGHGHGPGHVYDPESVCGRGVKSPR